MEHLHVLILALVQGVTEFLPVSSSAHLVLTHMILGDASAYTNVQEKLLDLATHIGTLLAVFLYFHKDLWTLVTGGVGLVLKRNIDTPDRRLALLVLVATLPVFPIGYAISRVDMTMFDSPLVIGWTALLFGILLGVADRRPVADTTSQQLGVRSALFIGCLQILALIPGVSRAGITMTGARFLNLSRAEAARFSLLMAMVTISGAGAVGALGIIKEHNGVFMHEALIGVAGSFVAGLLVVAGMMRFFTKRNGTMMPFVIYRIVLGVVLLGLVYGGVIPPKGEAGNPNIPTIETQQTTPAVQGQ